MQITESEREAFYKVLFSRRDVRRDFIAKPIPSDVIERILLAAHHAPSVGFMQPWDFIVISDEKIKAQIKQDFEQANKASAEQFSGEQKQKYLQLKLEGIMEAPLGICITCDRQRNGPTVLGRTIQPEMDIYSTVCAIQNLWLAARSENIGLGWVSILHEDVARKVLNIPHDKTIVAYLCLGYVGQFREKPELEQAGWLNRENLEQLIHWEKW